MQTEITIVEDNIRLTGPFSEENNKTWRSLGGRFQTHSWVIPDNETSRSKIAELFGAKSKDVDVEVLVPSEMLRDGATVQLGGYVLASRRFRDSQVALSEGVSPHHAPHAAQRNVANDSPHGAVHRLCEAMYN